MPIKNKTVGFLGTGHLAQSIIKALIESHTLLPSQIWGSNRSEGKLLKCSETLGIQMAKNNEELVEKSDIVIIAVKPQDMVLALESVSSSFDDYKIVISLAAGISLSNLKHLLPQVKQMARAMLNTSVGIRKSIIGICYSHGAEYIHSSVSELFSPLGYVVTVEEGEPFDALTVACSSGPGFIYELMIYWCEWLEEYGFDSETARKMSVQTFLGAALLAEQEINIPLNELQKRVVSKKGVTHTGLESMRELEIERALRISFEKAVLRTKELDRL